MHFLFGIALALGILWVLTCTKFGRIVTCVSVLIISGAVISGIALHNSQQAEHVKSAAEVLVDNAKLCAAEPFEPMHLTAEEMQDRNMRYAQEGWKQVYEATHPGCPTY